MATLRPRVAVEPAHPDRHFAAILGLYKAHGWIHATDPARLRTAIACSSASIVALDDSEVVGYARALSDEAFAVYIADILVRPDRQREGIGSALFRRSWTATPWTSSTTRCWSQSAAPKASTAATA